MSEKRGKTSLVIFAMIASTLFSKALGLFRSMLLAWTLGDSQEAVAFAAASKIPGAFFDIIFSAAISGAFIPHYSTAKAEGEKSALFFFRAFFGAALAGGALLSVTGMIFAPRIISFSAPGVTGATAALASRLLRIMFPSAVFTSGVYTLSGLMQSRGRFILPASVSAVSNIFILAYVIFSGKSFSVYTLAAVYVFSWCLQLLVLALPLIVKKQMPLPTLRLKNPHFKKALKSVPKIMVGSWLAPVSVLTAAFFSSFVSGEAFIAYDCASGIYTIISGVAVYGIGNYVFPALSKAFTEGKKELFAALLKKALLGVTLIIIPVFCAVSVLSQEGVTLLYAHGKFSDETALESALSLRVLSLAMPAFAVSEILYRALFAAGKPGAAVSATLAAIAASVAVNAFSLFWGGGLFGVCLAFVAAQWVHAFVLFLFAKEFLFFHTGEKYGVKAALLAPGFALCYAVMSFFKQNFGFFSKVEPSISIFLKITIVFTLGIVIYLLYVYVTGIFCPNLPKKEKR